MQNTQQIPEINKISESLLKIILLDRTTGKNILWATEDYFPIDSKSQIQISQITGANEGRIKPRTQKLKEEQQTRTRNKAEVFTPSWICNEQNNLIDETWFGRKNIFNMTEEKKWAATKGKIKFSTDIGSGKTWQDYIKLTRLEITCGEAPYLVSRYDSVTGSKIPLSRRIGLLDRKLRVVCENATNEAEFLLWSKIAFQNTYGFELQGDNLLLARMNLFLTFCDYAHHFLKREPDEEEKTEIAKIISWNLWQMDGRTFSTPFSSGDDSGQVFLFDEMNTMENFPCKIMDWKENKIILYKSLLKKRGV